VLGFLSKAAPQLNVFAVGFPVYLAVGFVVMIVGLPVFIQAVGSHFLNMREEMLRVLALAKG
jgi:flagellar biosynthetic protein FliR